MWINRILTVVLICGCLYVGTALRRPAQAPTAPPAATSAVDAGRSSRDDDAALLARRIHEVRFNNATLEATLSQLAHTANVNLWVDWKSLTQAGVDPKSTFTLNLLDITFGQVILTSVQSCAGDQQIFRVFAENGIVTLTTSDGPGPAIHTECFNLRPIAVKIAPPRADAERETLDSQMNVLADVERWIVSTIAPDSWRENGGRIGDCTQIGGVLIISQTEENLAIIRSSLQRLNQSLSQTDWLARPVAATAPVVVMTGYGENAKPMPLILECFNIRLIIDKSMLESAPPAFDTRKDPRQTIIDSIKDIVRSNIDPESWAPQSNRGGSVESVGSVLVVSQTPENLRAVRDMLARLHQAAQRDEFSILSKGHSPASNPAEVNAPSTLPAGSDEVTTITLDIGPILKSLGAGRPIPTPFGDGSEISTADAVSAVKTYIMNTVDPISWSRYQGKPGQLQEVGELLLITQKRRNIPAVRATLERLAAALSTAGPQAE